MKRLTGCKKTAAELADIFYDRRIALANDITKLHERVEIYDAKEITEGLESWNMKGEFVIVIEKGEKRQDAKFRRNEHSRARCIYYENRKCEKDGRSKNDGKTKRSG